MFVDTGRSANVLFQHYEASPEAIETSAQDLDQHARRIQAFSTETNAQHQAALANVSGVISQPLSTAAVDPTQRSSRLLGITYVSSGSIRLFGHGVGQFNHTIDNLNEQYRQAQAADFGVAAATYPDDASFVEVAAAEEARAGRVMGARVDLLRTLVQKYREARARLDQEAEVSAAKINEGPTEQVLQDLYAAGALPSTVETAFPNIAFTANTLPADFEEMSDADLAEYLQAHPALLNNDQAMAEIAQRIEGLTVEDGEASGRTLRDALSGKASMSEVEDELGLLSLVGMYGAYAQSRGQALPKGASQYVRGLFTDLVHGSPSGEDRTMDVLDWITAREHVVERLVPDPSTDSSKVVQITVAGFDQATQDWMKQAYADGILLMSNDETNGPGLGDYISPDIEAALNDVLRAEDSPIQARDGKNRIDLVGGDGFAKLADLLGHSSEGYGPNGIEPGDTLARELTESSAETAEVINTAYQNRDPDTVYWDAPDALERFSPLLEQAVDVAARNIDANEALLTEAGTNGHSPAAEQLRELYTFPWSDDGRSVSQYTDWIADYSVPDETDNAEDAEAELAKVEQAERASVGFINFVTDANGSSNNFHALMRGGTPDELSYDGPQLSFGNVNPRLAESFGLVAASNLEALGADKSALDTVYDEDDGSLTVGMEDRSRLFTLVATAENAANHLGDSIGAYEQTRLDQAIVDGRASQLQAVGAESDRLDGYLAAGLLNASMIEEDGKYQNLDEAYDDAMRRVAVGKTIVTGGLGEIPVFGGVVSKGAGLLVDHLITGEIEPPPVPKNPEDLKAYGDDDYLEGVQAYDYTSALLRTDHDLPEDIRKIMKMEFRLLESGDIGKLRAYLADNAVSTGYADYRTSDLGGNTFRNAAINEGRYSKDQVRDYLDPADE